MNNRIKAIILVAMTITVLVFIFLANKDSSDIKILTKKKNLMRYIIQINLNYYLLI